MGHKSRRFKVCRNGMKLLPTDIAVHEQYSFFLCHLSRSPSTSNPNEANIKLYPAGCDTGLSHVHITITELNWCSQTGLQCKYLSRLN